MLTRPIRGAATVCSRTPAQARFGLLRAAEFTDVRHSRSLNSTFRTCRRQQQWLPCSPQMPSQEAPSSTATGEVHHVLVEVERVRGRPPPGRLLAARRLVTGEAGLEHALAARQRRQLPLELIRPRRGQDRLYRRRLPLQRRRLDGGAEPRQ